MSTDNTSTVTRVRRISLAEVTSGKNSTVPPITYLAIGDGGIDGMGEPLIPSETQEGLLNEVGRYPIDSVTYPVSTTARYTATIPADDLAGITISEVGLFDKDGRLCAVKNMYGKRKDSGVKFVFEFDDEF